MTSNQTVFVGDVFAVTGGSVTVTKYENNLRVTVIHNDEHAHEMVVQVVRLRDGKIKNPFRRSVKGVGFIGVGKHLVSENRKHTKSYLLWKDMLRRCYCEKYKAKYPTYIGCSVHPDWHNFQNFAEWFSSKDHPDDWDLDKDLAVIGNKIYGPEFCSFVPKAINYIFNCKKNIPRALPTSVNIRNGKYISQLSENGKNRLIGEFDTADEAFLSYKIAKENYAKRIAREYKGRIDERVYKTLMKYEA